jgi:pilus assembly protein CpaD
MSVNARTNLRPGFRKAAGAALALSLGLALSACGGMPSNQTLESVRQPVVQRNSYVFDVSTLPGGGVSISEQRRLAGWFEAMDLRYGDKIAVDDPMESGATRQAVEGIAARYGMLVTDTAPVTAGDVLAGSARIVVTRTVAEVPGCPAWKEHTDANLTNGTYSGYGCAVNGNMALMVADKEHLVKGATGTGETVVMSSTKAIDSYREQAPTGEKGLKQVSSEGGK